jgi:hypothetical protein
MKKKHDYPFQLREALRKKNVKKATMLLARRPGLHKLIDPATGSELIALAYAGGDNAMIGAFVAAQQACLTAQFAASMPQTQPVVAPTSAAVVVPAPLTVTTTTVSPTVSKI